LAHCHLFVYFLGLVDDGELGGSLSFFGFFLRCRRQQQAGRLVVVSWFSSGAKDNNKPGDSSSSLGFFPQMQKMTRSWEVLVCCHLLGFSSSAEDEEEPIELFLLGRFKLLFFLFLD
jgi:hypothetical protein